METMLGALSLIVLGALAVPNLIVARRPDAKQWLDKLAPYQGYIGAVCAIWGIVLTLRVLLNVDLVRYSALFWLSWLADALLLLGLGLLLGVGVFKQWVHTPAAHSRLDRVTERLAPFQGKLGIAAILVGAWLIIARIVLLPW